MGFFFSLVLPMTNYLQFILYQYQGVGETPAGYGDFVLFPTESCFRHPLFDMRGTRKVEIRHTNFHFSSKKVTSKSRKVEVFDLTIVKKLSTFRPKKAKVEKLKSRKVEKLKS